jgi:hypothetical protein
MSARTTEPSNAPDETEPAAEPSDSLDDAEPWPQPGGDRFTDADLEPSPDERSAGRRLVLELAATAVAVAIAGLWLGFSLGPRLVAGPVLSGLLPAALAERLGAAMAQKSDGWGLGFAAALLATEVLRTVVGRGRGRALAARLRRMVVIIVGGCAVLLAVVLASSDPPATAGPPGEAPPGVSLPLAGPARQAASLRSFEMGLLALLVLLQVTTLPKLRPEEDEPAVAPAPPGPSGRPTDRAA